MRSARLGRDAGRADLLVHVIPGAQLAALRPFLAEMRSTHAAWARLARFLHGLADPGGRRCDRLRNIWLEFDLAGTDPVIPPPVPSLFLGPKPTTPAKSTDDLGWLLDAAAELTGSPVDLAWAETMARSIERLPEGGRLFQFGVMLSRPSCPFRLCFDEVPATAVPTYLERIGWPGDLRAVEALLAEIAPLTSCFALGLDAADRLGPRLGIECYADHDEDGFRRAAAIRDVLLRRGLAASDEVEALNDWSASLHQQILRDRWLAAMDDHPSRPSPAHRGLVNRALNHIKLALDASLLLPAKAYLGVHIHWIEDEDMRQILATMTARQPSCLPEVVRC